MNLQQIRTNCFLLNGNMSDVSDDEFRILLNKGLYRIYNEKEWEFLRKNITLTTDVNSQLTLPVDFIVFMRNFASTGSMTTNTVLWQGSVPIPVIPKALAYEYTRLSSVSNNVVPFGDNYITVGQQACYIDGNKIKFTYPVSQGVAFNFDYKSLPEDLILDTDIPIFPKLFHWTPIYATLTDLDVIERFKPADTKVAQWVAEYNKGLSDLKYWDSKNYLF